VMAARWAFGLDPLKLKRCVDACSTLDIRKVRKLHSRGTPTLLDLVQCLYKVASDWIDVNMA
jgi:hypothetical protein